MTDDMSGNNELDATLETGLGAAAGLVDLGDPNAMLSDVRSTVQQRRRRRQAFSGLAAVAALGASGIVLATVVGNEGDDLIVSAPPTDPVVDEPSDTTNGDVEPVVDESVADAGGQDGPVESTPAPTTNGVLEITPSRSEPIVDGGLVVEQSEGTDVRLFPWQGGFLAIRNQFRPQPLPAELPPEIVDQFPPEVIELFPGGLPANIDEAIDILEEAGLLGVVTEIISSNPEVSEAIYSEASSPVTTIRFSPDGVEWSDISTDFPVDLGLYPSLVSTGERFLAAETAIGVGEESGAIGGEPIAIEVWSSTDLVTWEQQTIALPVSPVDLPPWVQSSSHIASVAINDDAWVVSVGTFTNLREDELLDEEQLARIERGELYVGGMEMDATGVTIDLYPADAGDLLGEDGGGPSGDPEVTEFTWAELGLDEPLDNDDASTTTYTARWGEEPQETDAGTDPGSDGRFGFGQILAVEGGFVEFGSDLKLSQDGVRWSPVALPDGGYVEWVIETDSGLVVAGRNDVGRVFRYLFDPSSSEFTAAELGDLPEEASGRNDSSGVVMLQDFGDQGGDQGGGQFRAGGSIGVGEMNGYRFELDARFAESSVTISYTLTDIATGEVVSTETVTDGDPEFEFAKEEYDDPAGFAGFRVVDPASGEELLAIPFEEIIFTELDADGEPIADSERGIDSGSDEPFEVDTWLVAAVGESLVIERLADVGDLIYATSAAVQDDVALVATSNGAMIRFIPER